MSVFTNTSVFDPPPATLKGEILAIEIGQHDAHGVRIGFTGPDERARLLALRRWLTAALEAVEGAIAQEAA